MDAPTLLQQHSTETKDGTELAGTPAKRGKYTRQTVAEALGGSLVGGPQEDAAGVRVDMTIQ
jgi:hypothetical protein